MFKWMIAIAAVGWVGLNGLAGMDFSGLAAYRDYLLALGIALVMQPWFVRQLEE
jgi:hypothetical protein